MNNEIIVNGEKFVSENTSKPSMPAQDEQYCMVRTYSAGVFCGFIDPTKTKDGRNTVKEAKRIHHWENAASLSELAIRGTGAPEKCRIPVPVPIVYLEEVIEVIPMTASAIKTIESVPVWTK